MAGGPSNLCVPCKDVFVDLAPLSPYTCDHGSSDPIQVTMTFTDESGLPDAQGVCINFEFSEAPNSLILDFSLVA